MVGSRSCSHCCLYCHGVAWWAVFQRSIFCVREKNGCPEDKQEKKFSFDEGLWQLKDFFVSKRLPTSALLCTSNIDFHVCINVIFVAWCLGGVAFVAVLLWCIFGFDSLIPWWKRFDCCWRPFAPPVASARPLAAGVNELCNHAALISQFARQ